MVGLGGGVGIGKGSGTGWGTGVVETVGQKGDSRTLGRGGRGCVREMLCARNVVCERVVVYDDVWRRGGGVELGCRVWFGG